MKKLKFNSGEGYSYAPEKGQFEVRAGGVRKAFNNLSDARKYYDGLNEGKAIWNVTGVSELLECHTFE